jgi:hypothetical protein
MNHDAELYDVSREAQAEGISMPVFIDGQLMETITPSSYLESLGISREQRIINLLHLTQAILHPVNEKCASGDAKLPLPFMVLRGPLVREDCFTVTIRIHTDAEGKKEIIISQANGSDELGGKT